MQSKLFLFVGVPDKNSDATLDKLEERLKAKVLPNGTVISFKRKDKLLSARLEDTSYYITVLSNNEDIKDYYKMAKDFELNYDKKPVNRQELINRYTILKSSSSNLYKDIHYNIALEIFDEMETLQNQVIYAFQ